MTGKNKINQNQTVIALGSLRLDLVMSIIAHNQRVIVNRPNVSIKIVSMRSNYFLTVS